MDDARTASRGPAIGASLPRLEADDKASGRARYADDVRLPGMLHAALLTSPHAHARIVAHGNETFAKLVQIVLDIRVVKIRWLTPANLVHNLLSDLPFGRQRQLVARHVAQFGQTFGVQELDGQGTGQDSGKQTMDRTHDGMIYRL